MHQLAAEIKQQAKTLGFDLVGIAPAEPSHYRDYYRAWLDSGQAGTMQYLHKRFEERTNPAVYVPGAKSVICVAMNYFVPLEADHRDTGVPPVRKTNEHESSFDIGTGGRGGTPVSQAGRVARYALGDDYHEIIKTRLHHLADWIRSRAPEAQTRAAVDTAPVMEKELAARAGIGWMGKNTCIINEQIGSWIFLGEVITTLDLPHDNPAIDRCGTCRRCIDACPTGAITAEYQLDARRCISYLNIELRDEIPESLRGQLGEWLYGCDICQDVCPWNSKVPPTREPAFQPRFASGTLDVQQLLSWRDDDYRDQLRGSAMKRVKLPILQRNAKILLRNLKEIPNEE